MIARTFTDWPSSGAELAKYSSCSPNLVQLSEALARRWGMKSLGCHAVREIRAGGKPSTHSWGAALDMGYQAPARDVVVSQVCPYLVAWSDEWNISAVHDYRGGRIWRAGRTLVVDDACTVWWKAQRQNADGMGQRWGNWLHIEVSGTGWSDGRTEVERGIT